MSRLAVCRKASQMLCAMGRISSGREAGTSRTHWIRSVSVRVQTSARLFSRMRGARAFSESRVPEHAGHGVSLRNFSTRFMPFSSLTWDRAFSTV